MKALTIITVFFIPYTVVSGLFGMNVMVPFRDEENLGPFFGVVGFCLLVSFGFVLIFKCLKWL